MNAYMHSHITLRRMAVAMMYATYGLGALLQWQQHEIARQPQAGIILAMFVASFAIGGALFAGTFYGSWGLSKDKKLDEREIAVRNRVYVDAYKLIAIVSLAICLAWQLGWRVPHPLSVDSNVLLWGYVLLICTLPTALLIWVDRPSN